MEARYKPLADAVRSKSADDVVGISRSLLHLLAEEPSLLTVTVHPVGFGHAKLVEDENLTIRLHLWPIPAIPPQDPPWLVHRHAWPLTSYVIYGGVTNELYVVNAEEEGPYRLYSVGYEGTTSVMHATPQRISCTLDSECQVDASGKYHIAASSFHSTTANSTKPTATIAVTGRMTGDPPTVVGSADGRAEYRFGRAELPAAHVAEILSSLDDGGIRERRDSNPRPLP